MSGRNRKHGRGNKESLKRFDNYLKSFSPRPRSQRNKFEVETRNPVETPVAEFMSPFQASCLAMLNPGRVFRTVMEQGDKACVAYLCSSNGSNPDMIETPIEASKRHLFKTLRGEVRACNVPLSKSLIPHGLLSSDSISVSLVSTNKQGIRLPKTLGAAVDAMCADPDTMKSEMIYELFSESRPAVTKREMAESLRGNDESKFELERTDPCFLKISFSGFSFGVWNEAV